MGRPRTPTPILRLRGSQYAKERTKAMLELPSELPTPPRWMTPAMNREWERITSLLAAAKVLALVDADVLAMHCEAAVEFEAAVQEIEEHGRTMTTPNGMLVKNPYVTMKNEAFDRLLKTARELGLTPASRARVPHEKKDPTKTGKARFFKGG